jgi:hypothetical protein
VPSARAHLRQLLRQWGHAELDQDVSVVSSELVTNSVVASADLRPAAAPVLMWFGSDRRCLLLAVADASPWPFWDKKCGLWRVAEDDPDSGLHAESHDADAVIRYITVHDGDERCSSAIGRTAARSARSCGQAGQDDVVDVGAGQAVGAGVVLEGGDHPALGLDR